MSGFRLQVTFLGVRGSVPTPTRENLGFGGNTTCLEVRSSEKDLMVIDAGTGARGLGRTLAERGELDLHFWMTHFHWDHIQSLPFFAPLFCHQARVTFHSAKPPEMARTILEAPMLTPYFPGFESLLATREFAEIGDAACRQGGMAIHPFPLNHPQDACGFRIEAGGAVIVHASDLEHGDRRFDRIVREYAQNADVLIYDAQYSPEEYESKKGWGHSTWLEAARVARESKVKHLILFHHDPGHDDAAIQSSVEAARRHFENTDAAREGWTICV
jgi:phosphoribosyl 1,2-cyclic phosphodiesterase